MASSSKNIVVTVAFIFFLTFLPPKSDGVMLLSMRSESLQQKKMIFGSKPPGCVSKCLNCRPCVPTILVIHSHKKNKEMMMMSSRREYYSSSHEGGDDDDTYYLLSWKCKCGDKLFQP
ncbi:EPIDERMAL PATTERNING FACTOR-like protein 2-like [Tripterygium wilfordii]|uniref:Epidermal patterning factor-like protein n=1 Tax=Tripterygium wilfordii TaxID=458696 RepID=A0A7J7CYB7_TRIWF|nr:EPIDERMAL PATTERNING FACTOR-like protein 8 isoform X2 [Tripterygium wilfordii]KAF5739097.1 EPIDERMAL PATTERNING FACTOR-like protein 2-like [Tripterygium wilfordii]